MNSNRLPVLWFVMHTLVEYMQKIHTEGQIANVEFDYVKELWYLLNDVTVFII